MKNLFALPLLTLGLLASGTTVSFAEGHTGAKSIDFSVGGIGVISPKYEGSKKYRIIGFPIIIPHFSGGGEGGIGKRISFKGIDDVRFNLLDSERFEIGPVAGWRGGRDQDDGALLKGLGDIKGGLLLGGYAGLHLGPVLLDASGTTQLSGTNSGLAIRFGAETEHEVSPELKFTARVGATYASEDYADTFFGVSAVQSAASTAGLAVYNPSAGIKDIHLRVGTEYALNDQWKVRFGVGYSRLVGDAANSPVIETKDQFSGTVGFTYKLGWN